MADRSVVVRLRAEAAQYKSELRDAAKATREVGQEAERSQAMVRAHAAALREDAERTSRATEAVGRGLVAVGTATVAALGASAAAAARWESDWTGVLKTVDGTTEELAVVEGGLRELARTLPSTHSEIAAVAEAAGQLGVATKDIVAFTRVMIDLGETTNLTADEAATAIAQLMNVMQTAPGDVERLASALVALGNNGASTERDIIFMAQRIAGAGAVIGLTEDQVLGLANALASVGIEVEAGGSAISRVLTNMAQDVAAGGVALDTWARVAGVSGARFAEVWQGDPAQALTLFIEGLGRMRVAGEDVFGVLADLGQTDVRVSRALLTMATSGDLLADSLDLGARAWEENTALAEEAGKRYDTTAAKVEIARNNLNDAAIEIGEHLLPALSSLAEGVADVAQWFGALPEPLQGAATGLAGITGAAALLGGAFLLTVPRIVEMQKNLQILQQSGSRIPGTLRGIGRAAGIAAAAAAGFTALGAGVDAIASGMADSALSVEETTRALLEMQDASALDEMFAGLGYGVDSVESFEGAVRRLVNPDLQDRMQDFGGTLRSIATFGNSTDTGATKIAEQLGAIGDSLGSLVTSGHAEEAARQYRILEQAWVDAGGTVEQLRGYLPGYTDALAAASNEQALAAGSTEGLVEAYSALAGATEWISEEQAAWREEIAGLDADFISLGGAYDTLVERQRAWAEETAASTKDAGDSWEDYYDGFSVNLDEYIAELDRQVTAQNEWETNMVLLSGRVSQGVLDELARMGPEGAPLVAQLVNASDEQLARMEELYGQKSTNATDAFAAGLDESAPVIAAAAAQLGEDAAREIAEKLASGTATVQEIMYEYKLQIEGIKPQFQIDTTNARIELERFVQDAQGRKIYVDFLGRTTAVSTGRREDYVARAGGGPVFGPGTETSDSIPALLSTNEHVWSAAEVKGAGGHAAVAELRALARAGALAPVTAMRFADGGSPGYSGAVSTSVALPSDGWRISGRLEMGADGLVTLVDGRIAQAQARQTSTARMGVR